jgi:Cu+-exporting ATPase
MTNTQQSKKFTITDQSDGQLKLIVPVLYHEKERSNILRTLLLKREAIKIVLIEKETNTVNILFAPDKLAVENLLNLLGNVLKHFSEKKQNKTEKIAPLINNSSKQKHTFKVDGMSCESCALFLEMVLSREADITQVNIDFNSKCGKITGSIQQNKIHEIIAENGFLALSIESKEPIA